MAHHRQYSQTPIYFHCISCGSALGRNESLEEFPVGRRVAFDPHKGRLWVVCRSCRAWNLAPLEERWEAVEDAERLFERAALGASTENVALGRVPDGLELVRVGEVRRPEFARWRYGDRLLSRWRKFRRESLIYGGGAGLVTSALSIGTAPLMAAGTAALAIAYCQMRRPLIHTRSGELIRIEDSRSILLKPTSDGTGWKLELPHRRSEPLVLEGSEALRALRALLPRMNPMGGKPRLIQNAVDEVERLGSAERILREAAVELEDLSNMHGRFKFPLARPGRIAAAHPVIQLAVEIAANEETERRALEGEMHLLEREWRDAEEIAAISDNLLLPEFVKNRIRRLKEDA